MADQRIQSTEEMVGAGHATKADTLNRLALVEHNNDGTHNFANLALTGSAPATPVAKTLYEDTIVKAWVNISYSGGVPSIDDGVNVSSLTDNGTGDVTFNFATAFSNSHYGAAGVPEAAGGFFTHVKSNTHMTTTSCRVEIQSSSALSDQNTAYIFVGNN